MAVVTLPRGIWIGSECHREAELHELTGADEVSALGAGPAPTERASALLARCLARLGPEEEVRIDDVRALTVGDREALLLHLRRVSFGGRLECVLDCPDCGELLELDLDVDQLVLAPYADSRPSYVAELGENGRGEQVCFRLPTGADQEAAVDVAADPEAAAATIVRRCAGRDLPHEAAEELSALMSQLDPQAEISFRLRCPACERPVSATFDATDFLFRELAPDRAELFREIHLLALHYGWSEGEILALPTARRRLYLELLADSVGEATLP